MEEKNFILGRYILFSAMSLSPRRALSIQAARVARNDMDISGNPNAHSSVQHMVRNWPPFSNYQGFLHGHAEQGGRPRRLRSRDRAERVPPRVGRASPAGEQEGMDWLQALETVQDRVETLERLTRLHAQSIAHQDQEHKKMHGKVSEFYNDFEAYKKFVTDTHKHIDLYVTENFNTVRASIDAVVTVTTPIMEDHGRRMEALESQMAEVVVLLRGGAHHNISSPANGHPQASAPQNVESQGEGVLPPPAPAVPAYVRDDPWSSYRSANEMPNGAPVTAAQRLAAADQAADQGNEQRQNPRPLGNNKRAWGQLFA